MRKWLDGDGSRHVLYVHPFVVPQSTVYSSLMYEEETETSPPLDGTDHPNASNVTKSRDDSLTNRREQADCLSMGKNPLGAYANPHKRIVWGIYLGRSATA
jgi:hypothetical protein